MFEPDIFFERLPNLSEDQLLDLVVSWQDYTARDILAFRDYIYARAPQMDWGNEIFDCCGTGGDQANTFNISTSTAIVAAAAGIKVCKNGGRSSSSSTGSVDVLEALGVNLNTSLETKVNNLEQHNLAFYSSPVSAELLAPVKQVCRKNRITSFLSLIGPLTNPVKLSGQMIGVGQERWLGIMVDCARAIAEKTASKFLVLQSHNGDQVFDELTSACPAQMIWINADGSTDLEFKPEALGLDDSIADLAGTGDHQGNAQIIKDLLSNNEGQKNQARINTVAVNTAALVSLARSDSAPIFLDALLTSHHSSLDLILSGTALRNLEGILNQQ